VQNKIQSLAGQHSDLLENLSPKVRRRVEVLKEIQACICSSVLDSHFLSRIYCAFNFLWWKWFIKLRCDIVY
jgi:hypothetical protein